MKLIVDKVDSRGQPLRIDLQGLRGIGVLLVVIGHLWLWPQGAFAALDIFFVLSGFFITGLLIDEHQRKKRLDLVTFYVSRLRRLAPTALATIAVTIALTSILYTPAKADAVTEQGLWASVFAANWYFIEQSTDYFNTLGATPLIHFWSLSVEEQFYVVWPALLWLALRTARRRQWPRGTTLLAVIGTLTVAAFAYSLWHSVNAPVAAYFSTFDRVWEFGAGALVAVGRPWLKRLGQRASFVVIWASIALLIVAIAVLRHDLAFPAPWGLLPVLACVGLIVGGLAGNVPNRHVWLITNAPLVYLGTISYSLYLWHLPVNFLLRAFFPDDTTTYRIVALTLGIGIGALSFHLLERPVRRSRKLMTRSERRRLASKAPINLRPVKLGWLATLLVAALGLNALLLTERNNEPPPSNALASLDSPSTAPDTPKTLVERQQRDLRTALFAGDFPDFDPSLDELEGEQRRLQEYRCSTRIDSKTGSCSHGSSAAQKTAVVIGDSQAESFAPGIIDALGDEWTVYQFIRGECPAWILPRYYHADGTEHPECAERQEAALRWVRNERPELLILISAGHSAVARAKNFEIAEQGSALARSALGQALARFGGLSDRTAVIQVPPPPRLLLDCVTRFSDPGNCTTTPSTDWIDARAGERQASEDHGTVYVETLDWFCVRSQCPAFIATTPLTSDGSHFTLKFSRSLAPLLREALLGEK